MRRVTLIRVSVDKCYACTHVMAAQRPVLYVCRERDDWIFACGADDHAQSTDDWKVMHAGHLLDRDGTLRHVVDLDEGQQAERTAIDEPWKRGPIGD